ncbi:hypothetical protein RB620_04470 [Paenibacillus sp. LHD-117]|uniref:hypothetical protein n=1 Tax=Paenibacillus sp. LHD-117 TaxID=3071412 RepID=UPI0027E01439|nr:hypothetical protein [Paenibacillus sp. LHD-117]MDQ6418687.1 hypothetical protein [Paenibacillus sp. LHD-117]
MIALQLDFFEEATSEEIERAKSLLKRYRRHKDLLAELERMGNLSDKQQAAYNLYLRMNQAIERSVRLIIDVEIRETIKMRFIDGVRRKEVVWHFRSMDPSTVDRRINKGIISVANSLKIFVG